MRQKTKNTRKGDLPTTGFSTGGRDRKFAELLENWQHGVTIPDDPEFANRLMTQIKKNAVNSMPLQRTLAWASMAALLAVSAGLGLGLLLNSSPAPLSAEDELYAAANDLNINTLKSNPYDYLIAEPEN